MEKTSKALKDKVKYEKPVGVLPYNLPVNRAIDQEMKNQIKELPDTLQGKVRAGIMSTRFDVFLFEIVSFVFTTFFFYISPFMVINLPIIVNGL